MGMNLISWDYSHIPPPPQTHHTTITPYVFCKTNEIIVYFYVVMWCFSLDFTPGLMLCFTKSFVHLWFDVCS